MENSLSIANAKNRNDDALKEIDWYQFFATFDKNASPPTDDLRGLHSHDESPHSRQRAPPLQTKLNDAGSSPSHLSAKKAGAGKSSACPWMNPRGISTSDKAQPTS
jgi:hypothetical protein